MGDIEVLFVDEEVKAPPKPKKHGNDLNQRFTHPTLDQLRRGFSYRTAVKRHEENKKRVIERGGEENPNKRQKLAHNQLTDAEDPAGVKKKITPKNYKVPLKALSYKQKETSL